MAELTTIFNNIVDLISFLIGIIKGFVSNFGSPADQLIYLILSLSLAYILVAYLVMKTRTIAWSVFILTLSYFVLFNIV